MARGLRANKKNKIIQYGNTNCYISLTGNRSLCFYYGKYQYGKWLERDKDMIKFFFPITINTNVFA